MNIFSVVSFDQIAASIILLALLQELRQGLAYFANP